MDYFSTECIEKEDKNFQMKYFVSIYESLLKDIVICYIMLPVKQKNFRKKGLERNSHENSRV